MIAPFRTLCPSLTGNLTRIPGTWNASSTLLDASTLPGRDRICGSFPAVTTIVLTGRTTSEVVTGRSLEHPTVKQIVAKAKALEVNVAPPNLVIVVCEARCDRDELLTLQFLFVRAFLKAAEGGTPRQIVMREAGTRI